MKKILIIVAIIIGILVYKNDNTIIIPTNAVRLRVIANSNTVEDQQFKNQISKKLSNYINNLLINSKNSKETINILNSKKEEISNYLNQYTTDYKINIGKNYFPKKIYKNIEYEEGYYDSIVVELGKSNGLNWWCVIYPPLCLIDESKETYEYTSIVSDILHNFE